MGVEERFLMNFIFTDLLLQYMRTALFRFFKRSLLIKAKVSLDIEWCSLGLRAFRKTNSVVRSDLEFLFLYCFLFLNRQMSIWLPIQKYDKFETVSRCDLHFVLPFQI